ncbi:hypothetical protein HHI36_014031 [Cryptolaemus montrouzieri]|uniref:Uncharacterized protein n=1 Tax=Cryptolaemus montrouzieri TaxID=559131 RepID=A0ABD2N2I2_9CUCU
MWSTNYAEIMTVSRNSTRWPLTKNIQKRREFLLDLGLQLVQKHLLSRKDNERLPKQLKNSIKSSLNDNELEPNEREPKRQKTIGRCEMCPRGKIGSAKRGVPM